MSAIPKATKKQLLKLIDELDKSPQDKVRILGDAGITVLGAGLGAAAVGTLATAAGATSIFGVTTVASWLGVTLVAATPVGWIVGGAAVAGASAYGISRMIRGGGLAEGRKRELLQKYREDAQSMVAKENSGNVTGEDRTLFIISLRELIDKNVILPAQAFRLIEQVESGRISLSHAFSQTRDLMKEKTAMA